MPPDPPGGSRPQRSKLDSSCSKCGPDFSPLRLLTCFHLGSSSAPCDSIIYSAWRLSKAKFGFSFAALNRKALYGPI